MRQNREKIIKCMLREKVGNRRLKKNTITQEILIDWLKKQKQPTKNLNERKLFTTGYRGDEKYRFINAHNKYFGKQKGNMFFDRKIPLKFNPMLWEKVFEPADYVEQEHLKNYYPSDIYKNISDKIITYFIRLYGYAYFYYVFKKGINQKAIERKYKKLQNYIPYLLQQEKLNKAETLHYLNMLSELSAKDKRIDTDSIETMIYTLQEYNLKLRKTFRETQKNKDIVNRMEYYDIINKEIRKEERDSVITDTHGENMGAKNEKYR